MIKHVVLMKFRDGYSQEVSQTMIDRINAMVDGIPQIVALAHGRDASLSPGPFDYGLVADFASREDLLAYLEHPLHQEVSVPVTEILADAATMQFEYP